LFSLLILISVISITVHLKGTISWDKNFDKFTECGLNKRRSWFLDFLGVHRMLFLQCTLAVWNISDTKPIGIKPIAVLSYRLQSLSEDDRKSSVADPGCLSRILIWWRSVAFNLYWVAASRRQITVYLFMLHLSGGHSGTIWMQLAATRV
jgi:hypothetical protein